MSIVVNSINSVFNMSGYILSYAKYNQLLEVIENNEIDRMEAKCGDAPMIYLYRKNKNVICCSYCRCCAYLGVRKVNE